MGIGVDVCDVARLERVLARTPRVAERLFSEPERAGRRVEQLAARFAAKEAVVKALGGSGAGGWHDVVVEGGGRTPPRLLVRGRVAELAAARGVERWHVSLAHDGGVAIATVVAEGAG